MCQLTACIAIGHNGVQEVSLRAHRKAEEEKRAPQEHVEEGQDAREAAHLHTQDHEHAVKERGKLAPLISARIRSIFRKRTGRLGRPGVTR